MSVLFCSAVVKRWIDVLVYVVHVILHVFLSNTIQPAPPTGPFGKRRKRK